MEVRIWTRKPDEKGGYASAMGNNWERGNSTLHRMCIKEGEGTWKEDRGKNARPAG